MREYWNRCDICGKFIAIKDFGKNAMRELITPDTEFSAETYETVCKQCIISQAEDMGAAH